MTHRSLSTPNTGLRVFSASLLSALMIMMPFVQLAAAEKRSEVRSQGSEVGRPAANEGQEDRATNAAAENVFLNAPVPKPAPEPLAAVIVATKDDGLAAAATVAPGGTITYTVTINNNGADPATNVQFSDQVDGHTTLVSGSPVAAVSDNYNTIGNVQISVPAPGLLTNDFRIDTGNSTGMATTAETKSSSNCTGGCSNNVVISTDGSFTYNPPVGFAGTDTFTYTSTYTGVFGTVSATTTVKIAVANEIWFINNNAGACPGAPCDGRLSHPFTSLAAFGGVNDGAAGHPGDNDWIFVYESATAYTGPVTLRNGQKFIGQDATASLATLTGFPAPSGTDPLPAMNSGNGTIVNIQSALNAINLGSGNLLRGFTVGNTVGFKISGTNFGTLTVGNNTTPDVTLNGTGGALSLINGTFAATSGFSSVSSTNGAAEGVILNQVAGTASFGSTSVTNSTNAGVRVTQSTANINFGNTSVSGGTNGVGLDDNSSGTRTFGTLNVSGSSNNAFNHGSGGGNVTVTGAATLSSAGSAISVSAPGATNVINFQAATSATSTGAGISGVNWVGAAGATLTFNSLSITRNNGTALDASGGGTLNVSTAAGSITNTTPAGPAIIASNIALNANFASIFSSGGNNGVNLTAVSGTSNFGGGQLTGTSGGSTFQIAGGSISLTYSGGISQTTIGALVTVSGGHSSTGAVTFSGTLSASLGPGLQFSNADSTGGGGYHFTGSTTLNGGDAGIDILNGSSGTFNFGASTTVSNASAGPSFNVLTGNPTVNFNGTLSQSTNAQRVIQIDGTTGNTITFANVVTSTANSTGILIQNANGGNVTFTSGINHGTSGARLDDIGVTLTKGTGSGNGTFNLGNVNIFTNNANGIQATDIDGTINMSGTEIDSNNGTAIQIDGPAGLTTLGITLTRVDSTGGTANGITLIETNGTFTVNGDGANTAQGGNATGGTISGKSGANGSTTTGSGVYLSNVTGITLRRMTINGTNQNYGIFGSNVTGFILQYSSVNGTNGDSGPGEATDEGSIRFNNLLTNGTFPTAQIDNCNIANGFKFNLFVINSTAGTTLDRLMVTNNAFGLIGAAAGNDNIDIIARPNPASGVLTVKSTVQDNTFAGTRSDFVETFADGNSVVDSKILENKFNEGQATIPGGGVSVSIRGDSAGTASTHTYEVSCNRLGSGVASANSYDTVAMFIAKGNGNGTFSGSITNNVLGPPEIGAVNAAALNVRTAGNGTHTYLVQNNSITGYTNSGIYMNNQDGDATVNASLFGNTTVGAGFAFAGLFVDSGATATDNMVMNLVAGSATVAGNKNDFSAGDPANGSDVNLIKNATSTLNLSRNGSAAVTVDQVVKDNNLNPAATTVSPSGVIILVNTLPATPAAPTACTTVASLATERRADIASRSASDQPERDAAGNIIVMQSAQAQSESSIRLVAAANTREMSTSNVIFLTPIASALANSASEAAARIAPTAVAHTAEVSSQRPEVSDQKSEIRTHHAPSSKLETRNTTRDEDTGLRAHYATLSKLATRSATAAPAPMSGETVTANIGTLPAGGSVTITFQVTVNNPPSLTLLGPPRVENQGTVTADGGISVLTDDTEPTLLGAADKTATRINLFDSQTTIGSNNNPSNQGDSVTFTATVAIHPAQVPTPPSPVTPTGSVSFFDTLGDAIPGNDVTLCSNVLLNGSAQAQCATNSLASGVRSIEARYSGDGNYDPSTGTFSQTVVACTTNPVVTKIADTNDGVCDADCSLREAIAQVCNGTTITFAAGVGQAFENPATVTLSASFGALTIDRNMTILAPSHGVTVIGSGNASHRVFVVNASKTATITNMTITGGNSDALGGGGIKNEGTLTLKNSTVSGNATTQNGAGIHNSSVLNIVNSTISGNVSTIDGGGLVQDGASPTLYMVNSTVSGNTANGEGGGLDLRNGTATILNSTITGNHADNDDLSGGGAGGIRVQSATVTIRNTIVAGNYLGSGTATANDIDGTVSGNNNLIGDALTAGGLLNGVNGNIVGAVIANVLDTVLENNGGPTKTHRLITGSAALDAGADASLPTDTFDADGDLNTGEALDVDQRGQPRVVDNPNVANANGGLDIGAYEAPAPPSTPDLDAASDTGASSTDNYTSDSTPTFTIGGVNTGETVHLLRNGTSVANQVAAGTTIQLTDPAAPDGTHTYSARRKVAGGTSPDSGGLSVTIDTGVPGAPTIDLVSGSDSGSSTSDNITNAATRTFDIGNTETGATVELLRDGNPVGGTITGNNGTVQLSDSTAAVSGTNYAYTARQTDGGGNQTTSSAVNVLFDNVGPTVSMSSVTSNPTNTSPIPVTVLFNESVNGFTAADITPGNATVNNFAGSGANYTFDLVPSGQGTVTADINAAVAQDTAGNDNSAATQFSRTFDTDSPTANITDVTPDPRNTSVSSITIVFSEAVTGFDLADLTLTLDGGADLLTGAQTLSSGDNITWTLNNLSGITAAQGTYLLTLTAAGSSITDNGGNALAGNATDSWVMDTTAPTVTIEQAAGQSDPTSSSPINFTVVFSEAVTGFTNTDVTFSGAGATTATVTEVAPNNGTTYNVAISGMNADGMVQATVNVNAAPDGAGNQSAASTSTDNQVTFINAITINVQDAKVPEPASPNTIDMTFTVSLSSPAPAAGVDVDFTTNNGSATFGTCGNPGADYVLTSGTVSFTVGQQVQTINIPVCSDAVSDDGETFTVTLSSPTSPGVIGDGTATGTITANTAGTVLISELRTSGPGGAGDDFVEIYNNSNAPLTVAASDASAGYGLYKMGADCDATPILIGVIPNGTVIPARGHYLFVGSAYSLGNYGGSGAAAGNLTFSSDIETDANVGLFSTSDVTGISSANRLDAVGFGLNTVGTCNLLREATTLPPIAGNATIEHSYFRKMCDWLQGQACTVPGIPKDTNNNSADFWLADTAGSAITGRLGAPGPENLASPIRRDNAGINVFVLDGTVGSSAAPNRDRNGADPAGMFGSMKLRYRVTNNTGAPVTRLRYRIVDISTGNQPPGPTAELRALTSSLEPGVGPVHDTVTCTAGAAGAPPCTVAVQATTLETPPNQGIGGGYNSTLSSGTITATPGNELAPGASILINFKLGVHKTGTFRFYIVVEALP